MIATPVIRPMAAEDIDSILEIERATLSAPHWSRDGYAACVGDQRGSLRYSGVVAAVADGIVGFAVLRHLVISAYGGNPQENECELQSIVVRAEFRRSGVGFLLLAAAVAAARECGAEKLTLEVRESNLPAIRLYAGAGFRIDGRRPSYYADPVEDAVLLSLDLKEGA